MHWNSFADFLAMGGYAGYVWGSVGVMVALMVVEPLVIKQSHKTLIARLRRQYRAEQQEIL